MAFHGNSLSWSGDGLIQGKIGTGRITIILRCYNNVLTAFALKRESIIYTLGLKNDGYVKGSVIGISNPWNFICAILQRSRRGAYGVVFLESALHSRRLLLLTFGFWQPANHQVYPVFSSVVLAVIPEGMVLPAVGS